MSAVNSVVRSNEIGVLLGCRTPRPDDAPRESACALVSGGKVAKPHYWNWLDKFRFYVFG